MGPVDLEIPRIRVTSCNREPVRGDGSYVLYWMVAARRWRFNFALQHAVARAVEAGKPLVVLEALRVGYPWASNRFHEFILDGMRDNAKGFGARPVTYYPYVERKPGEGRGLLQAWASGATEVITDEFPWFFLPRMVRAAAEALPVRLQAVDGNGLLPLRAADVVFPLAHSFRRHLQKHLAPHLRAFPRPDPLADVALPKLAPVPVGIEAQWPRVRQTELRTPRALADLLPIDHTVPSAGISGGAEAATARLAAFLAQHLDRYEQDRNHPDSDASSGLSPYLHFGHLSSHEAVAAVMAREGWTPSRLAAKATGSRAGWWGMSPPAEAFLDQLVTWRELGLNAAWQRPDIDQYESLPAWARATLDAHASDPRPYVYDREQLERAQTHDPLWNAAQRQLVREGRIHNYLRMLWGKNILAWTRSPREALEVMLLLNDKYALDGRDPNTVSGVTWVLGRYDRAWGPERPIFGKVRYMTSDSARRKLRVGGYLQRYQAEVSKE